VANPNSVLPHLGPTNLRDRVVGLLERSIIDGQFAAGGRLPTEIQLGTQLGVSRTVVRDALRVLEARGLIEIRRGAGTRVRESTADAYVNAAAMLLIRSDLTVGDVLEARAALESNLAVIAAQNRSDENLLQIETALEAFAHAVDGRDPAAAARCHVEFHTQLVRATRLPALDILIRPLQQMMLATSLVPSGLEPDDPKGWRVEVHRNLFLAVESQSMEELEKAADAHWTYTLGIAFEGLRERRIGELYASPAQLINETQALT
jgi:GntR family transcriptional regulator, transcriptional repressor for pyruvate dehydrogenase complex